MPRTRSTLQRTSRLPLLCLILACVLLPTGCTTPTIETTPQVPDRFSFTLYAHSTKNQITYFELDRAGDLHYAGGMAAMRREGTPVTRLTPAQRQDLWDILMQDKLHQAPAGPLFPKAQDIHYDFALNTGGFDHIVRAVDDEQPGLKKLHDYLFNLQKSLRDHLPHSAP